MEQYTHTHTHKPWPTSQICEKACSLLFSAFSTLFIYIHDLLFFVKHQAKTLSRSTWTRLTRVNKRTRDLALLTFHLSVIPPYKRCKQGFEKVPGEPWQTQTLHSAPPIVLSWFLLFSLIFFIFIFFEKKNNFRLKVYRGQPRGGSVSL